MSSGSKLERAGEKETGRLEAFSDGVFAFAITLLVLYLKDPTQGGGVGLYQGLVQQWPQFFAFGTSFLTILIMWIGHHEMFDYIVRIDRPFMFLNGFLLFFITITPFTTSLAANHVLSSDSGAAVTVYGGGFFLLAVSWNLVWWYAGRGRLLRSGVTPGEMRMMRRNFYVGPIAYGAALLLAQVSGVASLVLILAVGVFYAVARPLQPVRD